MVQEILDKIGSENDVYPVRCQAITWTNADLLSTEPLGINFSEIHNQIHAFSFKKMHLNMLSPQW